MQSVYAKMVQQSRIPYFYSDLEVADTLEGRYDLLVIHAFIVMRKLKKYPEQTDMFAQSLWDLMFADMDTGLREMGFGDMGVARRVPKMAEAFYGRVIAYEDGLAVTENDKLIEALDRNLYRKTPVKAESLATMAEYLRKESDHVMAQNHNDILLGHITFNSPTLTSGSE